MRCVFWTGSICRQEREGEFPVAGCIRDTGLFLLQFKAGWTLATPGCLNRTVSANFLPNGSVHRNQFGGIPVPLGHTPPFEFSASVLHRRTCPAETVLLYSKTGMIPTHRTHRQGRIPPTDPRKASFPASVLTLRIVANLIHR